MEKHEWSLNEGAILSFEKDDFNNTVETGYVGELGEENEWEWG